MYYYFEIICTNSSKLLGLFNIKYRHNKIEELVVVYHEQIYILRLYIYIYEFLFFSNSCSLSCTCNHQCQTEQVLTILPSRGSSSICNNQPYD